MSISIFVTVALWLMLCATLAVLQRDAKQSLGIGHAGFGKTVAAGRWELGRGMHQRAPQPALSPVSALDSNWVATNCSWPVLAGYGSLFWSEHERTNSSCSAEARDWFSMLRKDGATTLSATAKPGREWASFTGLYNQTAGNLNPALTPERLDSWLNRVERFTF